MLSDEHKRLAYDDNRRRNLLDSPIDTAREIWQTYFNRILESLNHMNYFPLLSSPAFGLCRRARRPGFRLRRAAHSGQALTQRRKEMEFLVHMMEISPEMVAAVFHKGFRFTALAMDHLVTLEADELPDWDICTRHRLEPWTRLVETVQKQPMGDWFLTVAAALEYMLNKPEHVHAAHCRRGRCTRRCRGARMRTTRNARPVPARKPVPTGWSSKALTARSDGMNSNLALIAKTQSLIAAGDIVGAESALVELADTEGDGALMVVLEQLPPKDILAVIREYDNSKESVINLLVTPEMFARAVVIEKQYKDLTRTHLRGMINSVIFRDDANPMEPSSMPSAIWKAAARPWPTISPKNGAASKPLPAPAPLTRSKTTAKCCPNPHCWHRPMCRPSWNLMRWPTRTGCKWLGCCATSALTCLPRPYWCCVPRPAPMIWVWTKRKKTEEDDGKVETGDTDRGKATPAAREDDEESAI